MLCTHSFRLQRNLLFKPLLSITVTVLLFSPAAALTRTWTGLAGDGRWASAANWSGGALPGTSDDVLLDNALVTGSYTVILPDTAVAVKSLTITPAAAYSILLLLPATNTAAPAFTVTGPGYGLLLNSGGAFKNASGRSTGVPLVIGDSIRINNGGRYIHSSRTTSATSIIQYLSRAPGTEKGIFEFDVPGAANYDVSITKRTYGTLVFSATAAGANRAYTGTGANPLTINGQLVINAGATFNVNLSGANGNITVLGDYIQNGGVFNIASGPNNTVVKIAGNMQQAATGSITETDAGLPAIELNGTTQQTVNLQGTVNNSISFRVNNPAGVLLQAPLILPYKLELTSGVLNTSSAALLTLAAGCTVNADSSSSINYINGPLRKEGLQNTAYYLFPVGKQGAQYWAELKQATGNFTVEYIRADPHGLSNTYDTSLTAITNTGYWLLAADSSPAAAAYIGLAYQGPNTAGITDMHALRVAQLSGALWTNKGNTGYTGSAGAAGSVTGNWQNALPAIATPYTLAAARQNTALPVSETPVADPVSRPATGNGGLEIRIVQPVQGGNALVFIKAARQTALRLSVFSLEGKEVTNRQLQVPAGSSNVWINTTALSSGIYLLRATPQRGDALVQVFIKQ